MNAYGMVLGSVHRSSPENSGIEFYCENRQIVQKGGREDSRSADKDLTACYTREIFRKGLVNKEHCTSMLRWMRWHKEKLWIREYMTSMWNY